ncbi:MAG: electron transport complex subunit E [Nitrospirae bacterium]|nr:electron transport complex subunit E [Nitrospirota bacterium]
MKEYILFKDALKGLWKENPVFRQLLGMCPTLAVTNAAVYGLSMGLATAFVLLCSSIIISTFRRVFPHEVRIASFVVIIATFVTIVDLFLKGNFPAISKALGPYIPLIVVNCLILGRQEMFASKNPVHRSVADALGMGVGFTLALIALASIRELLGSGSIFGIQILALVGKGGGFRPWIIMLLPAGAFLTLGTMIGISNFFTGKMANRSACH